MLLVNFKSYGNYVTDSLYQWDINQDLIIDGISLDTVPEVHFSNTNMSKAIVKQAEVDDNGVISVKIPNSLLQQPLRIEAHVGIYEEDTFKVIEKIEIPVIARTRPEDYVIEDTDEELYSFKLLENMLAQKADNARVDNLITAKGGGVVSETVLLDHTGNPNAIIEKLYIRTNGIKAQLIFENVNYEVLGMMAEPPMWVCAIPERLLPFHSIDGQLIDGVFLRVGTNDAGEPNVICLSFSRTVVGQTFTVNYDLTNPFILELNDIRYDFEGNTHVSAGEAIRSQFEKLYEMINELKQ